MSVSFLRLPHVMCVEEQQRGQLLLLHLWEHRQDETHNTLVVVFEEAEVRVLTCELVREVRKLCDLEKILLLHLSFIES